MTALSRRAFVILAAALAAPRWARGQAAARVYRLGWIGSIDSFKEPYSLAFVFVAVDFDPVATGYVANPARPDGRITGVTAVQSVLPAKRMELLKELLPAARKVAVMGNDQTTGQFAVAEEAAQRLGLELHVIHFKRPPFDYEAAIAEAVQAKSEVLFVLGSGLFVPARRRIPELALKARLPSLAKILRGAKAGDIPVEQPTTYELAVNAATARKLDIRIPESIRVRVDRIVDR